MHLKLQTAIVAALIAVGSMAIGQETPAETSVQEDAQVDLGLDLGEPEGPAVGQPYILQEFGDWAMRCVKAPEGQRDPCNLYQLLFDAEDNAIAEVNFFRLPEGGQAAAGANIIVPLETLLIEGLILSVDGANPRSYPFRFCNAGGCVARLGFTQEDVDGFKRGASAQVRVVPAAAPDQEILLNLSLTGFTAGYEGVVTSE